ncbi:MINK1 isoform 4 [Pongo abelii]|uniref:MINK1 isoform 4 n=1 Tax=Pongo abelii TaxID=9601 RepID=A0A2J8SPP8_PONAB|nr:MINK1 isoform 4 [Pongo abelii]
MGDPAPARSLDDIDLSALRNYKTHRSAEKTLLGSLSLWRWSAMEPMDRCTRVGMSRRGSWLPSRSWMSRRMRRKRSNRRSTC